MSSVAESNIQEFADQFAAGQQAFDGQIQASDLGGMVAHEAESAAVRDLLTDQAADNHGFHLLEINAGLLRNDPNLRPMIGRVLLIANRSLEAFSPAIITTLGEGNAAQFRLTRLNVPFVPAVGFTPGQHFGLSLKAQTSVPEFGRHTGAGNFEAGHFSTFLIGTRNDTLARDITTRGDTASHSAIAGGVPEAMKQAQMLDISSVTVTLDPLNTARLPLYWHAELDSEQGPASGDYPDAVKLMLGAGFKAIGQRGLDDVRQLLLDVSQQGNGRYGTS
jgi:hypothetical protein